jgi:glycerol-3-phosphate dehydrogenase
MVAGGRTEVALLKESQVVDHAASGHPNLLSIFSVRYTTARHTAEVAVDTIVRRLGKAAAPCATATTRVVSARFASIEGLIEEAQGATMAGTDGALRQRLAATYGSGWRAVATLASQTPGLGHPLSDCCPITGAEVLHAVRREAAVTLADVLLRRTEAGTAGHPGRAAIDAAAAIMATALGWDAARTSTEVAAVEAIYPAA